MSSATSAEGECLETKRLSCVGRRWYSTTALGFGARSKQYAGIGAGEFMHEDLQRREKIKGSSDRSFGFVFAALFALVAFAPLLRAPHQPRWWAAVIAIGFALVALLWPRRLALLNRLWLKFGLLLHAIVSPVVLALIFYVAIVPVGLLKRIFGNDSLRLKADRAAKSYWIERDPSNSALSSMNQQF
jgi:hypothetical protein